MATSSSFTRGLQTSKSEAKELGEDTEVPVFSSIVENKKTVRIGGNTTSSGAKYQLFIITDFTKKLLLVKKNISSMYLHTYVLQTLSQWSILLCMHASYLCTQKRPFPAPM